MNDCFDRRVVNFNASCAYLFIINISNNAKINTVLCMSVSIVI